ncbi:MAG: hypothetical protein VKK04_26445 [Synechococcales bacterium]|nr:hypothetical protein [Synechococcales bacterium]
MNYLVAVLPNRIQAEAAYRALREENLPDEQINVLGEGYQSADEFGLIDPNQEAAKQSCGLAWWLIPFGFIAGYTFNWLTGIEIFSWLGPIGNHIVGGLLGAGSGALGALLTGGATGWTVGSGDAIAYRNRLNAGKYLIITTGTDAVIERATRILRQFDLENIQGYKELAGA